MTKNKRTFIATTLTCVVTVLMTVLVAIGSVSGNGVSAFADSDDIYYSTDTPVPIQTLTETFTYAYREEDTGAVNPFYPQYYNTNTSLSNACAPVAGAITVGYYDRTYTNLIPGYTPGKMVGGQYRYYPMTSNMSYPQGVIDALYTDMSVTPTVGTTRTLYFSGLSSYVTGKGYTLSSSNVLTSGTPTYTAVATAIGNGTPLTVFASGFTLCIIANNSSTSSTYTKKLYGDNHIMTAFGYKRIRYYNASGTNIRTDLFLHVALGCTSLNDEWLYVGASGSTLNSVDAVSVS